LVHLNLKATKITSLAPLENLAQLTDLIFSGTQVQDLTSLKGIKALKTLDVADRYDILVRVQGGGVSGQAGAVRLGIARALTQTDDDARPPLKRAGFLTRDARVKERKKYGLKKARKAPQYSKR